MTITYAASPNHSGIYWFDTEAGAAAWCRGFIIPANRVAPEVRAEAEAVLGA